MSIFRYIRFVCIQSVPAAQGRASRHGGCVEDQRPRVLVRLTERRHSSSLPGFIPPQKCNHGAAGTAGEAK